LSIEIRSAASPSIRTDGTHARFGRPRETTYFVASLSGFEPAAWGASGQEPEKMS
jgi:hypothetical protein